MSTEVTELEFKYAKELRIRHITALTDAGLNHKEFLFISSDAESYSFYHIITSKKFILRR